MMQAVPGDMLKLLVSMQLWKTSDPNNADPVANLMRNDTCLVLASAGEYSLLLAARAMGWVHHREIDRACDPIGVPSRNLW